MKNDERDARDLADLCRLGRLAQAWIAPREIRELRTGLKAQVHAVMAKEGVLPVCTEQLGPTGNAQLDAMTLGDAYTTRVESLRDLIALSMTARWPCSSGSSTDAWPGTRAMTPSR